MKRIALLLMIVMLFALTGCGSYSITGYVYDQFKKPISNATVYLATQGIVSTDSHGHFYFPRVKKGKYTVQIQKEGYITLDKLLAVSGDDLVVDYTMIKINTHSVTIHALDKITEAGIDASITLKNTTFDKTYGPKTGSEVTFTNIYEGDYTLTAEAYGYVTKTDNFELNDDISNFEVLLEPIPRYDLTVECKDVDTHNAVTATITLKDSSGKQIAQKIGSTVVFENILTGSYGVEATATDYFIGSKSVNLDSSKLVTVDLNRKLDITGTIIDSETDQPIGGASVTIGSWTATTNANGGYVMEVKTGNYSITVSKNGYATYQSSITITNDGMTLPTIELDPLTYINVKVYSSDIELTEASSTLTDLSTNKVVGTKTGANVTFAVEHFGNYKLKVTHNNYLSYEETRNISFHNYDWRVDLQWLAATAKGKVSFGDITYTGTPVNPANIQTLSSVPRGVSLQSADKYNGILVQFIDGVTAEKASQLIRQLTDAEFTTSGQGLYRIIVSTNVDNLLNSFKELADVRYVQPNYIYNLLSVPDDTYYANQWNLEMINMPTAWNYSQGRYSQVKIAVLDTGIRANSDLSPNIGQGYDVVTPDTNPYDDITPSKESHGTQVASIIGAVTNNGVGIAGAGWDLEVLPIKVCYDYTNGTPITEDYLLAQGIEKAVELNASVINISLGVSTTDPIDHPIVEEALAEAYQAGIAVIAATGNDNSSNISYPASSNYTLAVGAVDAYGVRTPYSNYGFDNGFGLVAPGGDQNAYNDIYKGVPGYSDNYTPNVYSVWEGTSFAAAQVSAVAGLVYTLGIKDPITVYNILMDTATSKNNDDEYGAGILNAAEALKKAANDNDDIRSNITIYAAKKQNNEWYCYTTGVKADFYGNYTVENIPANIADTYIIGFIDYDKDGLIEIGDMFGASTPYTYGPNQVRNWVDFDVFRFTANEPVKIHFVN